LPLYELAVKETDAVAFPAVAETLVGAVGVPPERDEDVPSIGMFLSYPILVERDLATRQQLLA
jgi:hypothetical protein